MKKIIAATAVSLVALVGCTSQTDSSPVPAPTVTVTEQAVPTEPVPPIVPNDGMVSAQDFILFVKDNGGVYAQVASYEDIVSLGETICNGFNEGLSEDEITYILAQALVNNDMGNDDGAQFGAALIVGAKNYLCGINSF